MIIYFFNFLLSYILITQFINFKLKIIINMAYIYFFKIISMKIQLNK